MSKNNNQNQLVWIIIAVVVGLFLLINPYSMMPWGGMMQGGIGCFGAGGFGNIISILALVALVLAIVWLTKQITQKR